MTTKSLKRAASLKHKAVASLLRDKFEIRDMDEDMHTLNYELIIENSSSRIGMLYDK